MIIDNRGGSNLANDAIDNINIRGNYPAKLKHIGYYGISNSSDVNVLNFSNLTEIMAVGYYFDGSTTTKHNNWQSMVNFHKLKWIKLYYKNGSEYSPTRKSTFLTWSILIFMSINPTFSRSGGVFRNLKLYLNSTPGNPYTTNEIDAMINYAAGSIKSNGIFKVAPQLIKGPLSDAAYNNLISRSWLIALQ